MKMSALGGDVLQRHHLVAVHRRLQGADRVDLGHHHPRPGAAQAGGRALADVAVAEHQRGLAGHHGVGGAADAVDQALLAAVLVVELRLGHAVVDVDRRERQPALLHQLVEPVHAGGGLLRDAADGVALAHEPAGGGLHALADLGEEVLGLLAVGVGDQLGLAFLDPGAGQHVHGRVAAVVEDHVGAALEAEDAVGVGPVVLQRLALDREDGDAAGGDGGGGVVLGGEDVARRPADVGAELGQRLDQHRGLDGHVQRAGDAGAAQRLGLAELGAQRHQAGHLGLGDLDLLAAEIGERQVLDDVIVVMVAHGGGILSKGTNSFARPFSSAASGPQLSDSAVDARHFAEPSRSTRLGNRD